MRKEGAREEGGEEGGEGEEEEGEDEGGGQSGGQAEGEPPAVVAEVAGLQLHLAPASASGYRGVEKRPNGRFKARP